MLRILLFGFFLCCCGSLKAQYTMRLKVKGDEKQALAGATVSIPALSKSTRTDSSGLAVLSALTAGGYRVTVTYIGMVDLDTLIEVPQDTIIELFMFPEEEIEEEVVVTATRLSRTIANTPTRMEVISGEELAEKGNMKPGDIRMMLNESTGIQAQQTSATSFNAGLRIQGLEGRYTQMLRDGYPLYAGFSGSLSLLQIAPLDLQQVEVIKGAASTLYGGGAIAGLVNLVSKTPGPERELNFLANGTSAGGLDLSGFYAERYGKTGLTVFASRNSNRAFDPAGNGMTAIPKFERYTINPRIFLYGKKTTADLGVSYISENRIGGSTAYIKSGGNGFFEKNTTQRVTGQLGIAHQLGNQSSLQFKTSYSRFSRVLSIPQYVFDAIQQNAYAEFTWNVKREKIDWVLGANLITEALNELGQTFDPKRNYQYTTFGFFVQNVWSVTEKIAVESGLRIDKVNAFPVEFLPRVSAMFRISPQLTAWVGGGFGYKSPTIFTEEAERRQFQGVLPIDINNVRNERSVGGNLDINYRIRIGGLGISLNQLFFYTKLNHPLALVGVAGNKFNFVNASGYLDTRGMETNIRLTYEDFKFFFGYTYTDANTHFSAKEWLPLTARHRLNNVLMYEVEDKLKIGLEAYYYSKQQLTDGTFGRSYWITGLMAEKLWEKFSVFINFENFTDTRQSKFDVIYTGTIEQPIFKDIYAPVDGFVVNGGVKIRL